ncbi:MAG: tRNA (adenosine(37)-N6)-dimethylallyltransferase MiaA [Rhodoferax sp.]|nr:tRNA (adenosine(37)-N6)-dimethylallyltransferase MiaA [Rhodoferax sp.]
MANTEPLPFHLCLAGPTASGKTAGALAIAKGVPCEIISVDSALVYRDMDIGTAKPKATERASVTHHLIDIRDPLHAYSAADFVRDASSLIRAIASRRRLPLLVGGTMLYFKALQDGMDDMPSANAALRAEIEQQAQQMGWAALHAELSQVDPSTAARLAPADSQRIQRALEVYRLTGRPLSALQARNHAAPPPQSDASSNSAQALLSLEPADRSWLHARIAERLDGMWARGFLEEVRALRDRGDLHPDLPSMRCVGYRQAWEALDGKMPQTELRQRSIYATRQLAKRQLTWLRSMVRRSVIACDAPGVLEEVLAQVDRALEHQRAHISPPVHRSP